MSILEVFIIGIGLSMDAFAVSVCKGLSVPKIKWSQLLAVGMYFGGFQALMPCLGYLLGTQFKSVIERYDHWIAFGLLLVIGINMIVESRGEDEELNSYFNFKTMIPLAVATSIDALAVGVTFATLKVNILSAVLIIGVTTFILSAIGLKIGNVFGTKYKSTAEIIGGSVLILMGIKILLEHLEIIKF